MVGFLFSFIVLSAECLVQSVECRVLGTFLWVFLFRKASKPCPPGTLNKALCTVYLPPAGRFDFQNFSMVSLRCKEVFSLS
jgi:hypothetical protein